MKKRIKRKIKTLSKHLVNAGTKKVLLLKCRGTFCANIGNFNVCSTAFLIWGSGYSESDPLETLPDGQSLLHK